MENKIKINIDMVCFIIFLVLKLDGVIDWKWGWVFSPFWIVWIVQLIICIVAEISKIEFRHEYKFASGSPLVWDAKTNTMHGPFEKEE